MMKPNFALTLSFDGIALLHRAFPGWHLVGEVALSSDDLADELRSLRGKAAALDPAGLRCKLVIPDDQIKYLTVPATSDGDSVTVARQALDGQTPYAVDDLVYDYAAADGQLHIAAVARETLVEAENFALEHDFTPLCFVASPQVGAFPGAPWFGPTKAGATLLAEGRQLARDSDPIHIVGASKLPDPPSQPEAAPPAPRASTPQPDSRGPATAAEVKGAAGLSDGLQNMAGHDNAPDIRKTPAPLVAAVAAPKAPASDGTASVNDKTAKTLPSTDTDPSETGAVKFTSIRANRTAARPAKPGADERGTVIVEPLPEYLARTGDSLRPEPELSQKRDSDAAPPEADKPVLSARKPGFAQDPAGYNPTPRATQGKPPQDAMSHHEAERRRMTIFGARHEKIGGKPRFLGLILMALLVLFLVGAAAWASLFLDEGLARLFGPTDVKLTEIDAPPDSDDQAPGVPRAGDTTDAATPPQSAMPSPDRQTAAPQDAAPQDPPAQTTNTEPRATMTQTATAQRTADPPPPAPNAAVGADILAMIPPLSQDPAEDANPESAPPSPSPQEETAPATDAISATADSPAADVLRADPASPTDSPPASAALTSYAASGIWQTAPQPPAAPSGPTTTGTLRQTKRDSTIVRDDSPERPDSSQGHNDRRLATPASPPAADTRFILDARGLVQASPDGALTPDGVTVIAGAPPVVPPRPRSQAIAAAEAAAAEVQAEELIQLAALRPTARPSDLVETAQSAEDEAENDTASEADTTADAQESDESDQAEGETASMRPRARPGSSAASTASTAAAAAEDNTDTEVSADTGVAVDDAAVVAAVAAATNEIATNADADPDTPEVGTFNSPTEQAIAQSLVPRNRPNNFENTVQAARTARAQAPVSNAQALSPRRASTASVAKTATDSAQIDLRQVNLIGVYGTPESRRALVRLSNGRYKKIEVGDRLDGGQVAAIGNSELRYVKRGTAVVLRLPPP